MSRTNRYTITYVCDECKKRVRPYDKEYGPGSVIDVRPEGWLTVDRRGAPDVNLCSAKCLQDWASKVEGSGG